MIISDAAVKNRISVFVLAIMIIIFGTYCYIVLPRESSPDITIPYVFVSTSYKGVSSSDIETSITVNIEKKLKGLDRVKKINSVSSEGLSQINIEFLPGTNIDEVLQKVKDKVDEAKGDLPGDLEDDPLVFEVNFSDMPIVVYSISGNCGLRKLKEIADKLEDDIEAIPGVLEVDVTGGLEREIRIEVDPDKLAYYRVPINVFQSVIGGENQNTSGGSITLGHGRYQLRVPGEFSKPEDIYGLIVSTFKGRPVYLKNLAKVVDGFKEEKSRSRLDGRNAVSISVKKRVGENIIAISDKIDELIERSSKNWPQGTQITKMMDKAKEIHLMVADLENNIISGLLLVIVVLFFALGFRNAVLVSLAIPFSMFLSFIILHAIGITLNMVVLFSLTLALGMLVDNAIVIIENIYRYMEQGVDKIEAAMKATSEVAWPVIGSTFTTLAAFFPMIFWPGIMGEFMKYLPITLLITLFSSLLVAMVINPALSSMFMQLRKKSAYINSPNITTEKSEDKLSNPDLSGESPVEIKGFILTHYSNFLKAALKHRTLTILYSFTFLIILVEIWFLVVGIEKPAEFFPPIDPKNCYINIDTPEGADLDYIDRIIRRVEIAATGLISDDNKKSLSDKYREAFVPQKHYKLSGKNFYGPGNIENVEYIHAKAVETSGTSLFESNSPNHIGIQFLDLEDRKTPSAKDIDILRERVKNIAGATITVVEADEGPSTGAPINIEISGDDFSELGKIANQIREILSNIKYIKDIKDNYVEGIPSIKVKIDRQKAALFGLSTNTIGFVLKTAYNGLNISTYRENNEDYDITVTLGETDRQVVDVLRKLMIPSPSGQLVPLTTLANINYSGSIGDIIRVNHNRVVTVSANIDESKITGPVARERAKELLDKFSLKPGYTYKFTGEFEDQKESEDFLSKAFGIALFLIFLLLVTIFNSVTQPLIIMTSVIISLGGVFLGLSILKAPFGIIMSGVGVISLAGVVVNNAIVLIDYTNKLQNRGMTVYDAIIAAGATRLRPVLLTAVTTILGLLPMVTGVSYDFHKMSMSYVSESTQWWQSMAIVVIFGLMVATFLTLLVVPVLYSINESMSKNSSAFIKQAKRLYFLPFERFVELRLT